MYRSFRDEWQPRAGELMTRRSDTGGRAPWDLTMPVAPAAEQDEPLSARGYFWIGWAVGFLSATILAVLVAVCRVLV